MSFEEEFPELKLFVQKITEAKHTSGEFQSKEGIDFVFCHAVEEHCLSKQRVEEAIKKVQWDERGGGAFILVSEDLLKELDLEQ